MAAEPSRSRQRVPDGDLDALLSAQFLVAWAGEHARLRWWRSNLVSRYGGFDLFARLAPHTVSWVVLQTARETARRHDAERRGQGGEPDNKLTLFHLGFERDEQADERLQHHKRSGKLPTAVLPTLRDFIRLPTPNDDGNDNDEDDDTFDRDAFDRFLRLGTSKHVVEPGGRRLTGSPPDDLPQLVRQLLAALVPLPDEYPLPYFRRRP